MVLHFCSKSIAARFNNKDACRGSNVILGMVLILGAVVCVLTLVSRLAAAI
jgi:hypothetical protein